MPALRTLLFLAAFSSSLIPCTSGFPVSVALASAVHHSNAVKQLVPQGVTKDVAVTSVMQFGPPFVNEGVSLTINIGVANNGTEQETFGVSLRDDTAGELIASEEVTLAAGGATTVGIAWDTTGATGGPPPPGPPTPGTIHALTASVTLPGDTVASNNSMSLLPGIWVIAAVKPAEIAFPERQKEPEGRITESLPSDAPPVNTLEEPLTEMYVGPVSDQQSGISGDPSIRTAPTSLTYPYFTEVQSDEGSGMAKGEVTTVAEPLTGISSAATGASQDDFLSNPVVTTTAEALNGVFLYQPEPNALTAVSGPAVATVADDLGQIFAASVDSRKDLMLIKSDFDGGTFLPPQIGLDYSDASLVSTLGTPGIATKKSPLSDTYISLTGSNSSGDLTVTGFDTRVEDLAGIFSTATQAAVLLRTVGHPVDTQALALTGIFSSAMQASWLQKLTKPLIETLAVSLNPAENGTIRGRIKLQGRTSSLGSYVEVGDQITFVDRLGYFLIQRPAGNFDLTASAPGYLSHEIRRISVEPGDTLVLPVVTLPFGDVDGDGVIDIYDLAVAAGNYGQTASAIWIR